MRFAVVAALAGSFACASAGPVPDAGRAAVWGYVTLVPKAGAPPPGDAYSDRRLQGVEVVDYSTPGFAVVYATGAAPPTPRAQTLAFSQTPRGPRWETDLAVVGVADELVIANRSPRVQIVSAPEAGWVQEIAPGASASLHPAHSGELEIHLLGTSGPPALVWASPGPYATANAAGRYELTDLAPGALQLRAWHPRLPPSAAREVALSAGRATRVDLEVGVDQRERSQP